MKVNLNPETAMKHGNVSERITESGAHAVTVTRAEEIKSGKGTVGVEFAAKDDNGATVDYLTIWTQNNKGEEIAGMGALQALMTCLRLKTIETSPMEVEKYTNGSFQKVNVEGFKDIVGKRVGFVLRKELYTKNNGGDGERMLISGFFDAETGMTAQEVLTKATEAKQLDKFKAWLEKSPVKDSRRGGGVGLAGVVSAGVKASEGGFDEFPDVPF